MQRRHWWRLDAGVGRVGKLCHRRAYVQEQYDGAVALRRKARGKRGLLLAASALHRVVNAASRGTRTRRQALQQLALLTCQEKLAGEAALNALLRDGAFRVRLSSTILCYPERPRHVQAPPCSPFMAHALDGALPPGMLQHLGRALSPSSLFWTAHGYNCGVSPFFSYV